MKQMKLFSISIIIIVLVLISGCGLSVKTPYAFIEQESDSQIFAYTDADVKVVEGGVVSEDTTLIIIGVRDNTGADLKEIFNHAMTKIEEIFHERQQVYKAWVK